MLVVDEFAAEFEVEFVEHFDALFDFAFLDFQIFGCIKTFFHLEPPCYFNIIAWVGRAVEKNWKKVK